MVTVCSMPVANEYTYQVTNEFIKTIRQDAYWLLQQNVTETTDIGDLTRTGILTNN